MDGDEDARLVGTGSFRVDAQRAFQVLRERQLALSFWRPALWIRCAAACGAKRMTFQRHAQSLVIQFDGAALPASALENPFALLAEGGPQPVDRWFGWALLHTAVADVTVYISSGDGAALRAAKVDPDGSVASVAAESGQGTIVAARWSMMSRVDAHGIHPAAWRLTLGAAEPAPFFLEMKGTERPVSQRPWERRHGAHGVLVRQGGRRVWTQFGGLQSRMRFSLLGTVLDRESPLDGFPLPASVTVDDPALDVDASLSAPVDGESFASARNAALAGARAAAHRLMARHAESMSLTGSLLITNSALRRRWVEAMGLPRPQGDFVDRVFWSIVRPEKAGPAHRTRISRTADVTKFLRHAAADVLKTPEADALDPLLSELWRVPLFFSTDGAARSLLDFHAQEGPPRTWDSLDPPAHTAPDLLWAISPLDKVYLRQTFPSRPRARR